MRTSRNAILDVRDTLEFALRSATDPDTRATARIAIYDALTNSINGARRQDAITDAIRDEIRYATKVI
jgi:hypothetical protein